MRPPFFFFVALKIRVYVILLYYDLHVDFRTAYFRPVDSDVQLALAFRLPEYPVVLSVASP
jgi:hypothetical protein